MAGRNVVAKLAIDGVEGIVTGFKRAGQAAVDYGKVAQKGGAKATAWVGKHERDLNKAAGGLAAFGVAGGLALAGVTKAAVDWESAWAGVTKTVDGTPDQLAGIEAGLRGLSKVLPATHEEIAAVAEAAGQLGISTENVLTFTKTMLDLGETTNLSADEAATTLSRFMNIMGTDQSQVSRLGSTIVELGNNFATTEAEIAAMGQRVAGVGAQMGLSEADVLGMSAAMSSVGVESEAGGTAISTVMKKIDAAVRDGGSSLTGWADVAGMSASDFATAWGTDAAGAMATVVEGLGGIVSSGGSASAALGDLGVKGIRETDTLNRLAGATEAAGSSQNILRDAIESASGAWDENMALVEEAQKRYETPAARIQMAINGIKDEAITLGAAMLPAIDSMLGMFTDLLGVVSNVPGPVKAVGTSALAIATGASLAAAGVVKLVTGLSSAKKAIEAVGLSVGTATRAMGIIGAAITVAGMAFAAWSSGQAEAKESVEGFSAAIKEQNGLLTEATRIEAARQAQQSGLLTLAEAAGVSLEDVTSAILGNEDAYQRLSTALDDQISANKDAIQGQVLAGDTSSDLQEKQKGLIETQTQLTGGVDELRANFGTAADASRQVEAAIGDSADASERDAEAKEAQKQAIEVTAEEMSELLEATQAYANELLAMSGSQIAVEGSIADLGTRIKELTGYTDENGKKVKGEFTDAQIKAGKALDLTTESGRKNQAALDQVAKSSMSYIETMWEQGRSSDEIAKATKRARKEWIDGAVAMGMSKKEAKSLADAYFAIPEDVDTDVEADGATQAKTEVDAMRKAIEKLPKKKRSELEAALDRGKVDYVRSELDRLSKPRTAWISVERRAVGSGGKETATALARGGIVEFFARGGMRRENHIAQIARAGDYRVWAEDETGGEAYIPLHPSKRARSMDIWMETGRRLGAIGFAGGGLTVDSKTAKTVATLNTGVFPLAEIAAFAKELKTATAPLGGLGKKAKDASKALNDADKAVAKAEKRLAKAQKVDPDSRLGKAKRDLARAEKVVDPKSKLGKSRQAVRDAEEKLASAKGKKAREKAEKELERAQKKNQKKEDARQRKIDEARERVDYYQVAKDKRVAEAEKKLARAQERQAKAQARQEKAADKLAEKQAKAEQAAKDLADAQQALADAAKSASESLRQTYMVGGDAADLLDNMRTGAKESKEFADLIEQLRKAGLDEDIIQEIIEQGATTGAETARDILSKGKSGIDDLNKAASDLRKATYDLGLKTAIGQKATGGLITGPGTGTSDSILTRTSNGEYVIRASSASKIGIAALDYANRYGRLPVTGNAGLVSSRASGAYTVGYSVPQIDATVIADAVADGFAGARIIMDGREIDARIETSAARTASRVRRGM